MKLIIWIKNNQQSLNLLKLIPNGTNINNTLIHNINNSSFTLIEPPKTHHLYVEEKQQQ